MRFKINCLLGLIFIIAGQIAKAQSCNITFAPQVVGTSCSNLCDGSVTLNPSGGTSPYTLNAFDHNFPGSGVDRSIFDVSSNGNYLVSGNVLTASPNTSISTGYNNAISTKQTFPGSGKIVAEASFYIDNNAYGYWGLASNAVITNEFQFPLSFFFTSGSLYAYNNGSSVKATSYSSNTWYDLKIEKTGNSVSFYIRQSGLSTYTLISSTTTTVNASLFKIAATYRNSFGTYGGFKSMNWKIGGNPPTTNLCPGTYAYTVYDAAGCYASTSITIGSGTGPSSLHLGGSVTPASCGVASDGAIDLTPAGGSGPYSYGLAQTFSGSAINTSMFEIRNGNFSQNGDLREGINVNSNNGWDNSIATRQTFSDGGYLSFEGSFKFDASCDAAFGYTANSPVNDLSSILMGFRVSAGSSLYVLVNSQPLHQVGTITPGTWYDFKIEKIGNDLKFYKRESGTSTYSLLYSTRFPSTIIEYKFGVANYSSFFSGSAGYDTKNWSVLVTPKVTRLSVGTYTYTITDANGCTATTVFAVGQATVPVELTANLVSPSVANGATGEVSLSPAGGNLPYKFQFEENFSDSILNVGWFNVRNGFFEETNSLRSSNVTNASWNNSVSTNVLFTDGGFINFSGSFKFDAGTMAAFGLATNAAVINDPSQLVIGFTVNGTQLTGRAGRTTNQVIATIVPDTWYDLKVEKVNGIVRFYIRNTGSGAYSLIYTIPYNDNLQVFKAGLIVFGTSAGLNTKDWAINSNPSLTGLAAGTYAYTVYDVNGCYATATINVPSIARTVISAQPANSSTWNVCDGSVSFSNLPANATIYNIAYQQSFAGTQFPSGELTVRNGSYTVNGSLLSAMGANSSNWENSVVTSASYSDNGYISAEMDMRFSAGSEVYFGLANGSGSLDDYTKMAYAFNYTSGKLYTYTAAGLTLIGSVNANTFYSFKIEKTGSNVNFYVRTPLDNSFQLVYTTTVSAAGADYRQGIINTNRSQAFSSRNWVVLNNGLLNNLCLGKYQYRISSAGLSDVSVPFTVNTNFSIVNTMAPPSDINTNTNAGVAYAAGLSLGNPSFSGNSSGVIVTNNAPTQFPVGTTIVTWRATDEWGNTATGNQRVIVSDVEAPLITAPATIRIPIPNGQTSISGVILGSPVTSDNVGVVSVTNNAPSQFPLGTTNVTWTAADAAGNTSTSIQRVIIQLALDINPNLLPQVIAPANVNTVTDPGKAYATQVNLGTPTLVGSTQGITTTNNAPSQFPVGTTTVTWRATNTLGNFITATQTVTVVDAEAPTVSASNITVPTNNGVSYTTGVNLGIPVTADNVAVTSVTNNAPSQFSLGNTTVTWTVKDAAGNTTTATQTVTVADREAPSVIAPSNVIVSTNSSVSYATGVALGTPVTGDNVAVTSVSNNAPAQFPLGATAVTWTVKDAAGNTTTGIQTVTVVDREAPSVIAPANVTVPTNSGVAYATGVALGTPVAGDNVGVTSVINDAPSQFPLGVTTVTWTAKDAAGNITTTKQFVTVADTEAPSIVVPANITVPTNSGVSYASAVDPGKPGTADNVAVTSVINNAPSLFPLGNTIITWTVKDAAGNTTTGTQTVTVIGPPTILAPANMVVPSDEDESFATITNLGTPTVNGYNYTVANNGKGQYNIGTNTITWTVTDQWNRTATAIQTITVAGAPTIAAPADTTIAVPSSSSVVTFNPGTPTYYVYNNASAPTNNAPSSYAAGTTNIIWTITDQWGRTASDIQVVNVIVPPAPSITAPPSITVQNDPNQTYATINSLGTPTYYAFGSQGPTNNAPSTARYNVGTNYVIWTVKDQFNRTASAIQTIIVSISCSPYSVSIASVQNSPVVTGSGSNVIYLGYGAQTTTLQATVPSVNGPYTFSWSGPAGLSSTTSAAPIFTPTKEGSYSFVVTAKNVKGCTSSSSITICVRDVRVLDINGKWDGKKVYVCHLPPGNPGNQQILSVSINAVPAHVPLHGGDGLGKTCTQPCAINNTVARGTTAIQEKAETFNVKAYPNPSTDFFSVIVKSTDQYTRITVRVMDAFGRTVQVFDNVAAGKEIKFGDKYASGAYYAEVIQGGERKVITLSKAK